MAKKSAAAASVAVRLNCILSGFPGDPGPGAIVTVDADEAKRLIDLGAAVIAQAEEQAKAEAAAAAAAAAEEQAKAEAAAAAAAGADAGEGSAE